MSLLPEPLEKLILSLERLPGIGPKTASRLAFFLLRAPAEVSGELAEALSDIKDCDRIVPGMLQHHRGGQGKMRDLFRYKARWQHFMCG